MQDFSFQFQIMIQRYPSMTLLSILEFWCICSHVYTTQYQKVELHSDSFYRYQIAILRDLCYTFPFFPLTITDVFVCTYVFVVL